MAKQVITIVIEDGIVQKSDKSINNELPEGELNIQFHLNNTNDDGSFSFLVAEGLSAIFPMAIQQVTTFVKARVEQDNRKIIKH
ncbi:hypothetical protein DNC95_12420 [Escherichia coli]|nr:hypothetical protein [Escherichia coli]